MTLPNPDYLTNEFFSWNSSQSPAVLISTSAGITDSKRLIKWLNVDNFDRTIIHDLIMGYNARLAVPETEANALLNFVPHSGYQPVNYNGSVVGANSTGLVFDSVTATSGQQVINVGGAVITTTATGLANMPTVYTANISVDGGANQPISISGATAQTYATLINEINADLTGATASLVGGNISIISASTGIASTISTSDVDLFSTLTSYVAINAAVPGVDAAPNTTTYSASVTVNGVSTAFTVTSGGTFDDLITNLNVVLPATAKATIVNGNVDIATVATGANNVITVQNISLFNNTAGFVGFHDPRVGVTTIGDIFDLNFKYSQQTFAESLTGILQLVSNKTAKSANTVGDIYFNHGTGTWLHLYNDIAPV